MLERALAESAVWHAVSSLPELAVAVCRSLRVLIPCDAAGWNEIDLDGRVVRYHNEPPIEVRSDALNRLIASHPVLKNALATGDLSPHTISDFLTADAFHRTRLYAEVYRHMGVEDQLAAGVEIDGGSVVAVALNRADRTFTDADRRLLDLIRPHIASSYSRLTRRAAALERVAALEAGLEHNGQSIVFVDESGAIGELPRAAEELLVRWFGKVPERLAPGDYERADGILVARDVEGTSRRLLLLDERRFVSSERASEYGLTTREAEVCALAARGLSNRQIGEQLGISARTVHKHFQNIYDKLGVRSRSAAIAALR
jgi:DNA-binding CsgD family transcriptional regulator